MILDAGVLVAAERGERRAAALARRAVLGGRPLSTSHAVVGQVWRGSARQARLARFLKSIEVHPLDDGREVGRLLARAGTQDVVDAHVVLLAASLGDDVLTGDVDDLERLAEALPPAHRPLIRRWP